MSTSTTYEIPVTLTLYPDLAATIELEAHYPHYDWAPIGQVPGNPGAMSEEKNHKCYDPDSGCAYSGLVELKVQANRKRRLASLTEGLKRISSNA